MTAPAPDSAKVPLGIHLGLMVTMAAWALNVSAVKWLTGVTDVRLVAALRMLSAVLVLVPLLLAARQSFPRWRGRMLAMALGCALLMVYANQMLFAAAMERTTAGNAALILALNPLLNGVLEAWVFRKRLSAAFVGGALLAVAGVLMVVLNREGTRFSGASLGDLMVAASMLAFAGGVLVLQRLSRDTGAVAINTFLYSVGTVALLAHALVALPAPLAAVRLLGWWDWGVILFSGAIVTALGGIAWARGVAAMGMGRAAIYMSWVPVMGVGFGAVLLNEKLTEWHFFGMILVLMGTILSSARFERTARLSKM
ncbi:DMT family transporter [Massilia niastensis]|uniref:DMT family transporter n=1 Tax=Massilia niastensis TaxID=544911 RepID=UPI00036EB1CB|nr:DMT family transporter [Massilia niastensis]